MLKKKYLLALLDVLDKISWSSMIFWTSPWKSLQVGQAENWWVYINAISRPVSKQSVKLIFSESMHLLRLRSGHWMTYPWGMTTNWTSCITPWPKESHRDVDKTNMQFYLYYGLFLMHKIMLYLEEPMGIISLTKPDVCSSGKVHRWRLHNPFVNSKSKHKIKSNKWVDIDTDYCMAFKSISGGSQAIHLLQSIWSATWVALNARETLCQCPSARL